jgi:REP element-mobilizing transposase RayT
MAYVKNWLHCVWGTKDRLPYLSEKIIHDVLSHIKINAKEKGIYLDSLNGHKDHLHCLLSLNPDQSLSKVMQLIKGEASYWINRNGLMKYKFEWAEEYFGVSISESDLNKVRNYINNQKEHHRIRTWEEEYNRLMADCGFDKFPG